MLEGAWEKLAEDIVNTKDIEGFLKELAHKGHVEGATFKGKVEGNFLTPTEPKALVFIGMDTRDSSQRLIDAVA